MSSIHGQNFNVNDLRVDTLQIKLSLVQIIAQAFNYSLQSTL